METRRSLSLVNMTWITMAMMVFGQVVVAQRVPQFDGEMKVESNGSATTITTDASEKTLCGSWRSWYPVTHSYDYRSRTDVHLYLDHLDSADPPGTDSNYFGYGRYKITVEGNSIYMDYRDADYHDGETQFGTGYNTADMAVYYNHSNGYFYKDAAHTQRILGSIAIWQDNRKTGGVPKIPVTVTNSMNTGQVTVRGSTEDVPAQDKWPVGSGATIVAISPQTFGGVTYSFSSWSDGGAQSHTVTPDVDDFGTTITANFTVSSVAAVTNLSVGGSIGEPVHISWTELQNADVDYHIYRKVRHNGVMGAEVYLSTVAHGTSSYDDDDYQVSGLSSNLLYYDARAHHNPSGVYASGSWAGGVYGQVSTRKAGHQGGEPPARPLAYGLTAHPNPFNPETHISFDLPDPGQVTLGVYDLAGREVGSLVKGFREAGSHQVSWKGGSSSSSGIYLVRLTVSDELGKVKYTKAHKLLLVK